MSAPNTDSSAGSKVGALAGQKSEEARAVVQAQRALKGKKDALRKLAKKLKGLPATDASTEERTKTEQDIAETEAEITKLEAIVANGAQIGNAAAKETSSAAPQGSATSPASEPTPATETSAEAPDPAAEKKVAALMGQETEEAKLVVKLQRELKKKEASLRKAEKKLKGMSEGDGAARGEVEAEVNALREEIDEIHKKCGTQPAAAAATVAAAVQVKPNTTAKVSVQKTVPAASGNEGEAAKQKLSTTTTTTTTITTNSVEKTLTELIANSTRAHSLSIPHIRHSNPLKQVHYRVAELGLLMQSMLVVGGNARTLAMISAFREMLKSTPVLSCASFRDVQPKDVESAIETNFNFLLRSRAPSPGMRYVKYSLIRRIFALSTATEKSSFADDRPGSNFSNLLSSRRRSSDSFVGSPGSPPSRGSMDAAPIQEGDPREVVLAMLESIETELLYSLRSIIEERSVPYVSGNDTILVFGRSSAVEMILLRAAKDVRLKSKPKVIVIDASPLYEGREMARRLNQAGLVVSYGLLTSCCTLLPQCTKVFIGASAVLQNGDVFSRCGTALVVASAKQYRKPVICFCESFKFVSEVWLGSLAQNSKLAEVQHHLHHSDRAVDGGSTPASVVVPGGGGWGAGSIPSPLPQGMRSNVSPLVGTSVSVTPSTFRSTWGALHPTTLGKQENSIHSGTMSSASGYLYDLTPAAYVDMIVCEMGSLHTSAIVAAIRDREDREAMLAAES